MADGAVSFAIETVRNVLIREGKLLYGVKDQVKEMQRELELMQCFLEDAERRKGEDKRVQIWVKEIREAAYDAEDVIEHFVLKSALWNQKGVMNRVPSFFNHPVELHQVGSRIAAIKTSLSNLRTSLQTYGIIREPRVGGEEASSATGRRKSQDYPHIVDHNVVGLDGKITELVDHLLDGKESSVVCLYGMGGLGKTTTAKKVYRDSRIRAHFECFAWVYISQQCDHNGVWESILIQLTGNRKSAMRMSEDELTSELWRLQKEKKCLLVIDDIWSSQDWDKLSPAFPYMEKDCKSQILLTSRNQSVALHGVYHTSLNSLDHVNSLELLKNTILFLGGPNHPLRDNPSMNKYAGEMVKQCVGLPLAVVVLGGILARKHESAEWERFNVNIKLVLKSVNDHGVGSVLESSYLDLPYYLKSCFLYLSQYREDEQINVTELIQRWIGEGFIPSSMEDGDETMEDVARGYLNELVSRCMIQVGRRGHTGRVKTCRMHDLMRDLCISKSREEGFAHTIDLRVENEGTVLEKVSIRRLCIYCGGSRCNLGGSSFEEMSPQLRSILFRDVYLELGDDQAKAVMLIIKKLKSIRVLELPNCSTWNIWGGLIENLIHLRLLRFTDGNPKLPTSIGNLRCLQTLKLGKCKRNLEIPDAIWGIEQLRHLYLPWVGSVCESSKQPVGNLGNLQTLVNFPPEKFDLQQNLVKLTSVRKLVINSQWEEKDKISRSQQIMFNRLQSLSYMHGQSDQYVDLEDITRGCPHLYRLIVRGPIKFPETATVSCTSIWPSNLTKLVLGDTKFDERHMGTLAKLQSLKVLFLRHDSFIGKEMIFHPNDFPQLQHLKLVYLLDLGAWSVEEGALPSLFRLEIASCRSLQSVPDGFQFLKQMKELKVEDMPNYFRKRLQQGGKDWDRVSHVPSISFTY